MRKLFSRLTALVLAGALIIDPALARSAASSVAYQATPAAAFDEQALMPRLGSYFDRAFTITATLLLFHSLAQSGRPWVAALAVLGGAGVAAMVHFLKGSSGAPAQVLAARLFKQGIILPVSRCERLLRAADLYTFLDEVDDAHLSSKETIIRLEVEKLRGSPLPSGEAEPATAEPESAETEPSAAAPVSAETEPPAEATPRAITKAQEAPGLSPDQKEILRGAILQLLSEYTSTADYWGTTPYEIVEIFSWDKRWKGREIRELLLELREKELIKHPRLDDGFDYSRYILTDGGALTGSRGWTAAEILERNPCGAFSSADLEHMTKGRQITQSEGRSPAWMQVAKLLKEDKIVRVPTKPDDRYRWNTTIVTTVATYAKPLSPAEALMAELEDPNISIGPMTLDELLRVEPNMIDDVLANSHIPDKHWDRIRSAVKKIKNSNPPTPQPSVQTKEDSSASKKAADMKQAIFQFLSAMRERVTENEIVSVFSWNEGWNGKEIREAVHALRRHEAVRYDTTGGELGQWRYYSRKPAPPAAMEWPPEGETAFRDAGISDDGRAIAALLRSLPKAALLSSQIMRAVSLKKASPGACRTQLEKLKKIGLIADMDSNRGMRFHWVTTPAAAPPAPEPVLLRTAA